MGVKRIDAETRQAIVAAYLADDSLTYKEVASRFGVSTGSVTKIINDELNAGNGVKPDRRSAHPEDTGIMQHITPLHKRKQELEQVIEHRQAELDKAKQEYRDFMATLKQLLTEVK